MTSWVSWHPHSAVFSSVLTLFLAGSFPCGIKMTAPPGFYPIFSIPFSPNQFQDGVSLALIGSLNPSWLQREDVGGRQSALIGQAWVTHTLGAKGMSAPLDHRAEEGSGRRCVSLRGIMGQTRASQVAPANAGDAGDAGSVPGSGRSPGGGSGKPLPYSCWNNPMGRGAWQAPVHGVTKSQTWLSSWVCAHTHTHTHGRQIKTTHVCNETCIKKPQRQGSQGFWVGERMEIQRSSHLETAWKHLALCCASVPSACSQVRSFYNRSVI